MAFTPDSPFPKTRGHVIKSKDWNDAITEVQRLDNAKVNRAGDSITGRLNVSGNLGVGTANPQEAQQIGTSIAFHNGGHKVIGFGWSPSQGKALEAGFPAEVRWAPADGTLSFGIDSASRSASGTPVIRQTLTLRGDRVGIGHTSPPRTLQIGDDVGGVGFSPSDASPNAGYIRFGDNTGWKLHFGRSRESSGGTLNSGAAGTLLTIQDNGNVGVGTTNPGTRLEVNGDIAITGKNALRGPDPWLRLNDFSAFTGGTYTRGLFAPDSLNVGGIGGWGNPGAGNVWVTGRVGIGATDPGFRLDVADRIRLRQAGTGSAGLWLHQTAPNQDRAFIGMRDDTSVGLWGNTGAGWGMFMNTGNGDVTITGRLGTGGWSPTPRQAGWGGGIHTWDIEAEATIWSRNAVQTGPRDLAENFSSDMDLEPGDVVCIGDEVDSIVVSEEPNDGLVLGVVSSEPGFLLNVDRDVEDGGLFPVALCGRVSCKVVDESGPIARGDLLTTSSTPGYAMKASSVMMDGREIHRPGTIIGKALGSFESGTGTIEVFVTSR